MSTVSAQARSSARWWSPVRSILAAGGSSNSLATSLVLVAGAVLMVVSALIHLRLWASFHYRSIPTIGPLFMFQSIAGVTLAVVVAFVRRVWAAVVALAFVASTIGGFLLSLWVGLFGFQDGWSAPFAATAFFVEIGAVVLLGLGAFLCYLQSPSGRRAGP